MISKARQEEAERVAKILEKIHAILDEENLSPLGDISVLTNAIVVCIMAAVPKEKWASLGKEVGRGLLFALEANERDLVPNDTDT